MKKEKQTAEEPIVKAVKAIGANQGKVAASAEVYEGPPRVAAASGKFEKTNKSRLPRKVKKVHQKKAVPAL